MMKINLMQINEEVEVINDVEISNKYNNKFKLVLDGYTKDSIYDEDDYPLSIDVEIKNIMKRVTIFVPEMEDSYRNSEIAKESVEYAKELIYKIFANTNYIVEVFAN